MIPVRVNCTAGLSALAALVLSCAPASSSTHGAESTTSSATATVPKDSVAANKDPDVARADLGRITGKPDAKLWVIIVSDFQCPYCKQWHDDTYPAFRDEYVRTGKVRFAYINYPLNSHRHAWPAAQAAMCAAAQGKFWEMHDALFATQAAWEALPAPLPLFDSLARSVKLDTRRWSECVSSGKMRPLIQADHDRALGAGATSTPTFLIGGDVIVGAIPIADMRKAVDSALTKAGRSSP